MAAQGLFLQSGLQPQMVLTTGQDAEVFHVVSNKRLHHSLFWDSSKQNIPISKIPVKKVLVINIVVV